MQVLPRANISVNGLISGQTMYTLQVQPFTLSVLASEKANGDGVSIAMQCFGSSDSTWTPTLFNFSGSTQTLTGVYTASATAAVGESCTFTLTGPDVYHYNTLPPLNWTTTATATFNLSYAVEAVPPTSIASSSASIAAFAEQRIALTLLPTEAPLVTPIGSGGITVALWLSAGSTESTSPLPYTWLPRALTLYPQFHLCCTDNTSTRYFRSSHQR